MFKLHRFPTTFELTIYIPNYRKEEKVNFTRDGACNETRHDLCSQFSTSHRCDTRARANKHARTRTACQLA